MKLRYIFTAIVSSLCLLVACQQEDPASLSTIQLEKTFLSIPLEGGSVDLNLVASAPWAFAKSVLISKDPDTYAELPAWLTASALSGEMGAAKITFSAAANGFGREQELQINTGSQIQYIVVRQGSMEAEKASCAEVIAGADGKTYTVTGTCTSIANTQYGNWYLNDGKDEIYIYGTLDKDGGTKNFLSLGIEVGDVITVQGPKTTYGTTVELVDVTVLKIVKSLLKVDKTEFKDLDKDGAEFSIKAAFKGNGAYVKECPDWISLASTEYITGVPTKLELHPADTSKMTFRVAPNEGVTPREGIIKIASTAGKNNSDIDVVVSQKPNAPALMTIAEALQSTYAHVKGTVMAICKRGYVLVDETGAILCYYGSKFDATKYKLGDVIEVINATSAYNYGAQLSCDGKDGFDLEEKISEGTGSVTYPTPKVLDQEGLAALVASISGKTGTNLQDAIKMEYVQISVTPKKSGSYTNLFLDNYDAADFSAYQLPADFDLESMIDKKVTVRGYTQSVSSSKHVNIVFTEMIEGEADVPTIEYTDLSTINALADNAEFTLTCVTVASGKNGIVVSDGTTGFYVYKPATTPNIGDIVTVAGTKTTYYNLIESKQGATVTVVESGAAIPELSATDVTSTFDDYPDGVHGAEFISFTGKYQTSGSNVNVTVEGATKRTGSLQGAVLDPKYDGKNVKVSGYYIGTSGTGGIYFVLIATKIEEV